MYDNQILERNFLSLSLHNKDLVTRLSQCGFSDKLRIDRSRSGNLVPVLRFQNRDYALHSLFDPVREGHRYSSKITGGGYVVVFGFGACYHISELLKRKDISGILIIEKDMAILKSVLREIDLSVVLSDPRISVLIDNSIEEIMEYLLSNYLPAVYGDFQTITLRSRVDSEKEYFNSVMESIRKVLGTLSDDYTVQTWFGKRWFSNSVANLSLAGSSTAVIPPQRRVSIAAAGPSLEMHLPLIEKSRDDSYLISTDTALSCLMKSDIIPDLVISIDCQQITYHHFMSGYPADVPLVMDLASPPALSRLTGQTIFFTSGHPFSLYAAGNWRKFPFIDTSGGNVTHAALSLADSLGASEIFIYGADYSYPEGKSYARGTYIYPYFYSRSGRTSPTENSFYSFLYRNSNISKTRTEYGYRYTTRPMLSYKERLEKYSSVINGRIIAVPGMGEKINIPGGSAAPVNPESRSFSRLFSAGKPTTDWKSFLSTYRKKLSELPVPEDPPSVYFSGLEFPEKDIWTTLFPVAAVLRKKYRETGITSAEVLMEVRSWALDIIDRYIS